MSLSLLKTKLHVPQPRPNFIPRPRLMQKLNQGLAHGLILISAPAGFGKTTLAAAWLHQDDSAEDVPDGQPPFSMRRSSWLSLEEADNDPVRFWRYLVAALQQVAPAVGETTVTMLQAPQLPAIEILGTALLNDLTAVAAPCLLVLDDYHLVTEPAIHKVLNFLLDHRPPSFHLAITTRVDPPLALARRRARMDMVEVRAEELRFTEAETAVFLNQAMGLSLSPSDIKALEARTEGWIAGLQLAALSLQGIKWEDETAAFIQAFTGSSRYVLDYLVEEVLQQQRKEVQTFLLQTAILSRLSAPLCTAVTGREDSRAMLEELEQANLFIVAIDQEHRWYRYQHLFAGLLAHYLHLTQRQQVPQLHQRAAAWYEQEGYTAEAIEHALAAEAFAQAATLIEGNAMALLNRGELKTLLGWIGRLPGSAIRSHPWLHIYHAWALLLTAEIAQVEPHLQEAERALAQSPTGEPDADERRDMGGHIAAIRTYAAAISGDVAGAIEQAQEALALLPSDNRSVRSVVAYVLGGVSLLRDDIKGAARAFAEAGESGRVAGNIHVAVPALSSLAAIYVEQGLLHRAQVVYEDALQLGTGRSGRPLPITAAVYNGLGRLHYEWNDLRTAAGQLQKGMELGEQWGNLDTIISSRMVLANVYWVQGNSDGAVALFQEAEQIAQGHNLVPVMESWLAAFRMWMWLLRDDVATAVHVATERGLDIDDELTFSREREYLMLARILLAQKKTTAATSLLARLRRQAEQEERRNSVIQVLVLEAIAHQAQGSTERAVSLLQEALTLAAPQNYVRSFLDGGSPLFALLQQAAARGIIPRYVQTLLAAWTADKGEIAEEAPPATPAPLLEPLSERELEVLSLIAEGLTNREIAQKLIIALGTVKAHTASIYGKLEVNSRTQAVARARELNLL